jgi:hypothetical protein
MVRLLETIQTRPIGWIMCVPNPLYSYHFQMTLNEWIGRIDCGATGICVCVCVCVGCWWGVQTVCSSVLMDPEIRYNWRYCQNLFLYLVLFCKGEISFLLAAVDHQYCNLREWHGTGILTMQHAVYSIIPQQI